MLLIGDFNRPNIDWCPNSFNILEPSYSNSAIDDDLTGTMNMIDLQQINTIRNSMGRALDLAFTNLPLGAIALYQFPPLSKPDLTYHPIFEVNIDTN